MIDCVVRRRQRAVAARIERLELIIHINLFAGLETRQHSLVAVPFKLSAIKVDRVLGVNPVAMILQKPIHAVRSATFFVGSEREDKIAIGQVVFLFEANKCGDQQCVTGFHVFRATTVEEAVLLEENEGIARPVFAAGFDNVQVADNQNWFALTGAAITQHQIFLVVARTGYLDVPIIKAGVAEPFAHGFGSSANVANRIRCVDFDEFLQDFPRQLLVFSELLRKTAHRQPQGERQRYKTARYGEHSCSFQTDGYELPESPLDGGRRKGMVRARRIQVATKEREKKTRIRLPKRTEST